MIDTNPIMQKEDKKQKCELCGGSGLNRGTLPISDCEECGGSGRIEGLRVDL